MTEVPQKHPKPSSGIVLYQTKDGRNQIEVRLEQETVWLTQQLMDELFQTTVPNISIHIRNIFADGKLTPKATGTSNGNVTIVDEPSRLVGTRRDASSTLSATGPFWKEDFTDEEPDFIINYDIKYRMGGALDAEVDDTEDT